MAVLTAVLLFAAALAAWTYRFRLTERTVVFAAISRAVAVGALLLLLFDPGMLARFHTPRPLVLVDNSVSMHAAGGSIDSARALGASLGDTTTFGELVPGEPGGRSELDGPIRGALGAGRPVVVVTDGEIADATLLPPDLLAQITVRRIDRRVDDDVALTRVTAPARATAGDTVTFEVELTASGTVPDTSRVVIRDGSQVLAAGTARFDGRRHARVRLSVRIPTGVTGERWIDVVRSGEPDAEPDDDLRQVRMAVTPTPGVVVLAASPDWDARFLYRTLREVVESPVRGYVQLEPGRWRRMDDLTPVAAADVAAAAARADLLAVRGDTVRWRQVGRARLLWAPSVTTGDWYLTPAGASPIMGAFAGLDPDSLPPAVAVAAVPVPSGGWVGMHARLARRGDGIGVLAGRDGPAGRTVIFGVDGLYRWAFRGGASDQAWRTLIADAAAWLLGSPDQAGARAQVVDAVTQRGRPVRFRWAATGAPTPLGITLEGPGAERIDSLRFDGAGEASLALPVGKYQYQLDGGGRGSLAVEPFSDELVPAPPTLERRDAEFTPTAPRRSLRDMLWLFALAVAGFGSEWMIRRKLGLI
ncbi:MAG: hypothetical protein H0W15_10060 [Gemmatimonadales bacterium]|nr:hypothetical protein [Gemmatimonadales bacterium]